MKYVFLGPYETLLVIVASDLNDRQEEHLLTILKSYKGAIGWTMADLKGISPSMVQHHIYLEEEATPTRDHQR